MYFPRIWEFSSALTKLWNLVWGGLDPLNPPQYAIGLYIYVCVCVCVLKGEVHPRTGHKSPEGSKRYSSTLSLTLALDGGGWSIPCPGQFTPSKEMQYPLYKSLGGPQDWSGWVQKISPPPGFDLQTFQLIASCYIYIYISVVGIFLLGVGL
jgi:hypothetical protein